MRWGAIGKSVCLFIYFVVSRLGGASLDIGVVHKKARRDEMKPRISGHLEDVTPLFFSPSIIDVV